MEYEDSELIQLTQGLLIVFCENWLFSNSIGSRKFLEYPSNYHQYFLQERLWTTELDTQFVSDTAHSVSVETLSSAVTDNADATLKACRAYFNQYYQLSANMYS